MTNKMVKIYSSIILLALFLAGCRSEPVSQETVGNDINLKFLFEKDGCKVYRFTDWHTVYITTCPNSSTQYYNTSGKHTYRVENNTILNEED